jgi:ATP-dependent Clp protease ATP-binding subunit ClpX
MSEATIKEIRSQITINDLKKYGMIPELLGRFPIITNLQPLEINDLISILKLNTGIIEEYKTLFELQGKKLIFTDDALDEIAKIAINENTGARGLKAIIEKVMMDIMYESPSEIKSKYRITKNDINEKYNINRLVA